MFLSSRVIAANESITLKINQTVVKMGEAGKRVFNLTAGQLPFKPMNQFIESINAQTNFLKSYQYSPVAGFEDLRKKILDYTQGSRDINFKNVGEEFDVVLSNGAKHSIYNVLGAVVDPGDEVILLAPYWVSYPEMIKFWGGNPICIESFSYDGFTPDLDNIRKAISRKTKAIILNSPNNPTGISYSKKWMEEFAKLMIENPEILIISDEIYYEIAYFDPKPTYFYQAQQALLARTIIVDGISKSLACTGLRMGWAIGPKKIISAITKLQGQTTSGPSSLIQRALTEFDFTKLDEFLVPVRNHLRKNSEILREKFRQHSLSNCWYQSTSAFYFMIDYKRTPYFEKLGRPDEDLANEISLKLLESTGIAVVPGSDFGAPNTARISIVLEEGPFTEAMDKLTKFLSQNA